jgi:hypothetical protein
MGCLVTRSESGQKGGKVTARTKAPRAHAARRLQAAKDRAAKREEAKPPAPLPPFLVGDTSGLPKAPPGRKVS